MSGENGIAISVGNARENENSSSLIAERVSAQVESAIGTDLLSGVGIHPQLKPNTWREVRGMDLHQGRTLPGLEAAIKNKSSFDSRDPEQYKPGDIVLIEYEGIQYAKGLSRELDYNRAPKREDSEKPGKIVIAGQIESIGHKVNTMLVPALHKYNLNLSRGIAIRPDGLEAHVPSLLNEKNGDPHTIQYYTPLGIPLTAIRGVRKWSPTLEELPYLEQTLYARLKSLVKGNKGLKVEASNVDLEKIVEVDNLSVTEQRLEAAINGGIDRDFGERRSKIEAQTEELKRQMEELPREQAEAAENAKFQLELVKAMRKRAAEGYVRNEEAEDRKRIVHDLINKYGFKSELVHPGFYLYVKEAIGVLAEMDAVPHGYTKGDVLKILNLNAGDVVDMFKEPRYGNEVTPSQSVFFDRIEDVLRHCRSDDDKKQALKGIKRAYAKHVHPDSIALTNPKLRGKLFAKGWGVFKD